MYMVIRRADKQHSRFLPAVCLGTAASPSSPREHFQSLSNTLQNRVGVHESVWLVAAPHLPHLPMGCTRLYALLLHIGTVVRFSRVKNGHLLAVEVVRNWGPSYLVLATQ